MSDFDLYESEIEELYRPKEEPKVVLTVEEAKVIEELALLCLFLRPKAVTIEKAKVMKELNNRIEQAEGR